MKKELFKLLVSLGFERRDFDGCILFQRDADVFVFPSGRLQAHHYFAIRKHLDLMGYMDKRTFTEKFLKVLPI